MNDKVNDNLESVFVVIPAHNEENRISKVIAETLRIGFSNIIVVNDASTDNTRNEISLFGNVVVLDHLINLGPGAATQTGFEYCINKDAKFIATIDADYQHDPNDLLKLHDHIKAQDLDLVVGSRFLGKNRIPFLRRCYNFVGNWISYLLAGKYVTDSQSGLKIIKSSLVRKLRLQQNGFEFCIEIIKNAKLVNAKIGEIPINVSYTPETTKKGQNIISGFSMLKRIFSPFS